MLYDKRWDVQVEQPSLKGLIAWLETQPGDTTYNFLYANDCLVARYLKHIDHPRFILRAGEIKKIFGQRGYEAAAYRPHTYKAALRRAYGGYIAQFRARWAASRPGF